jgi:hypothetical protein
MNRKVKALLTGAIAPGIYRTDLRVSAAALARAAEAHGWRAFDLDGRGWSTKREFLEASARAMGFPGYFGHNWDAFEESLNDMNWAPAHGYLVVFDGAGRFARAQPAEFAVALDILRDSVRRWGEQDTPLVVLVRGAGRAAGGVPWL